MLSYTLENKVAVVRMDDGKANALSYEMIDALLGAAKKAETEASAMVLAGRADKFCAGFDLKVMSSGTANAVAMLTKGGEMMMALYGLKMPLVIACTGHAMAGGAVMLLTGDVRIGSAAPSKIGFNEVTIGLALPIFALELARERLTAAELTRATVMAHIYDSAGALSSGFLDEVAPADQVVTRAIAEATRLGALPNAAFVGTKSRLRAPTVERVQATFAADLAALSVTVK